MNNDHMTSERLAEIQARVNAATDGSWMRSPAGYISQSSRPLNVIAFVGGSGEQSVSDAEFICASRTDIPDLMAEVRRLTELCDSAYDAGFDASSTYSNEAVRQLWEENARLTAELSAVRRERDAAVHDLNAGKGCQTCQVCRNKTLPVDDIICRQCGIDFRANFVWRGSCTENAPDGSGNNG